MRCLECGKRFNQGDKICIDDEDQICMNCLEDRIWMRHGTEEIAESLGYEIKRYKKIENQIQPILVQLIPGQVCMF